MKKKLYLIFGALQTYFFKNVIQAEMVIESNSHVSAPSTSDTINIIIMMLCISGIALILLILLTIIQKYRNK